MTDAELKLIKAEALESKKYWDSRSMHPNDLCEEVISLVDEVMKLKAQLKEAIEIMNALPFKEIDPAMRWVNEFLERVQKSHD